SRWATLGDLAAAEEYSHRAVSMARAADDLRSVGHFLRQLGLFALQRNDLQGAARYFADALPALLETEHGVLLADTFKGVASLALRNGQLPRAAKLTAIAERLRDLHGLADRPIRELENNAALAAVQSKMRE